MRLALRLAPGKINLTTRGLAGPCSCIQPVTNSSKSIPKTGKQVEVKWSPKREKMAKNGRSIGCNVHNMIHGLNLHIYIWYTYDNKIIHIICLCINMHTVCNQNICLKDFNQETCVLIHSTHACTFASVLHIGSNFIQLSCKFWNMHKKVTNLFVTSVERNGATQTHHSKKRK